MNPYLIDDAAHLTLENGRLFSDTPAGQAVLAMAHEYARLQELARTGAHMPVAQKEDMSPNGRLQLYKEVDGDIIVTVIGDKGEMASIQFCVPGIGGGKSGRTLAALNALALAMLDDNREQPARVADR